MSMNAQPGLGVVVIWPYDFDRVLISIGPNEAIPIAEILTPNPSTTLRTFCNVSVGVVVGTDLRACTFSTSPLHSATPIDVPLHALSAKAKKNLSAQMRALAIVDRERRRLKTNTLLLPCFYSDEV